ncbi:hypothetical protein O0L34_g15302 [Tuta absoluta]|nr:hypothetical protein O0L34_g15302 [Tuta absoluta]
MYIVTYVFPVMVACISYLVYHRYNILYPSIVQNPDKRYDYVIVGAGTAGCVLAARLSENPSNKVLLVEAGDHMGFFTGIPLTPTAAQLGPSDWSVRTTRQKYSSFGLWDQTQILPRGKGLGGSGQINFLLHGLGFPWDYENWSRKGFRDWTYSDLEPYFFKAFGDNKYDSKDCDTDCPFEKPHMKLKQIEEHNELLQVFKQASTLLADKHTIFKRATATVDNGRRRSSYDAYLKPYLNRHNLHVLLKTQAVSIRFENETASSIYILKRHRELDNIFVNKEIILSAGAIKTPQILMLSGIGPREVIQKLKINLVSENEYVGKNLHDHMNMPLYVSIRKPISITLAKVFDARQVWNYFWNNEGLLAFPPVAGVEFQNSSALMLFSMGTANERLLRDLSNYYPQVFRDTFPFYNDTSKEGFMFLATCLKPKSRGTVTLRDSSISIQPVVDPNYLHYTWDVKCIMKALRRAERLIETEPFKNIGARIHWPRPERCLSFWNYSRTDQTGVVQKRHKKYLNQASQLKPKPKPINKDPAQTKPKKDPTQSKPKSPPDEYLECIIREVAVTGHHAGGTCAGGSVVDDQLRVRSVSRLRIMDASVMPSPLSLYPNSVLIAMAERAADLITNSQIQ